MEGDVPVKFWKDTAERAARAFAAAFVTSFSAGLATATTLPGLKALVIAAGTSALAAVLSLVATRFGDPGTASFVKAEGPVTLDEPEK